MLPVSFNPVYYLMHLVVLEQLIFEDYINKLNNLGKNSENDKLENNKLNVFQA